MHAWLVAAKTVLGHSKALSCSVWPLAREMSGVLAVHVSLQSVQLEHALWNLGPGNKWVRTEMPSPLREVCFGVCFGGMFRGMFRGVFRGMFRGMFRGSLSCHLKKETRWAFFIDT